MLFELRVIMEMLERVENQALYQKCIRLMPRRWVTITSTRSQLLTSQDSITLEEIENVDGLVNNLEKIELPNQLISVLADPLLQKLMLLKPDATAEERINSWLETYAEDVVRGETTSVAELTSFLEILQGYVSATKVRPSFALPTAKLH